MDPLEKEQLRRRMAQRMRVLAESAPTVECVSGHYQGEAAYCELCQETHAHEMLVLRNRKGKTFHVAQNCLREMVRFQVTDAVDLGKWLGKMKDLRADYERRQEEQRQAREVERRQLEKRVIVRRRPSPAQVEA